MKAYTRTKTGIVVMNSDADKRLKRSVKSPQGQIEPVTLSHEDDVAFGRLEFFMDGSAKMNKKIKKFWR